MIETVQLCVAREELGFCDCAIAKKLGDIVNTIMQARSFSLAGCALISTYAPEATIRESRFTGNLRAR